jgi:hypothetical protein
MLRLISPAQEGQQATRPPGGRRYALRRTVLTPAQAQRVRAATANATRAAGSAACLAQMMDLAPYTVRNVLSGYRGPSLAFTARLAKATGTTTEALLSGVLMAAECCPHCGAERRAAS